MAWIKARLRERSTYVGLVVLLGFAGIHVPVEALELLGGGLVAVAGAVEMGRSE